MLRWNAKSRHLSISEKLLAALNYPHVLTLEIRDNALYLYQRGDSRISAGKERRVNYPLRAMPRLGIGDHDLLPLLQHGVYKAVIKESLDINELACILAIKQ